MQFGIISVSDITRNPVTGQTPSEAERIQASVQLAKKADEVGLDVPVEPHDRPVTHVATASGVRHLRG